MVAANTMILSVLTLGNTCLLIHLYRRWERATKVERMMVALRVAIRQAD